MGGNIIGTERAIIAALTILATFHKYRLCLMLQDVVSDIQQPLQCSCSKIEELPNSSFP